MERTPTGDGNGGGSFLLTARAVGDLNRARVLQALCDRGAASRAELARIAGVPRATIGVIVSGLIDAGLVEELAPVAGRTGKPATPVWFRRDAALTAAVSFDGRGAHAALVNARGELLQQTRVGFRPTTVRPRRLLESVADAVSAVLPRSRGQLLGVGVAVPGVCDTASGEVVGSSQLPAAAGTALVDTLRERFDVPVLVDNDARAQALGEKWFGDGRGVPTFASVQTGAGLGVGLVMGGVLYRGDDGRVGELGHTCVEIDGDPCTCGLRGCWETVASLRGLRAEAARRHRPDAASVTAASLTADGDAELLAWYADRVAVGLATLVQLVAPQRILLHGDVVGGGRALEGAIADRVRARSLPHVRDRVDVRLSTLDQNAALLGAAGLVLSETFRLSV